MAASLSPFASLRHRNFRLFFTGQTTSLIGTWMQSIALGWLVLQLTNSAFQVGLISALSALPVLLFSLPAGVIVDRGNKQRIVIWGQLLMLVQAGLLTVLTGMHVITVFQLELLAFFGGCLNAIEIPARQSFFVDLVGKEDLTNAIALNSTAYNVARIVGPSVAGIMIAKYGVAVCFGVNSVSYIAVLIALLMMRLPPHVPAQIHADVMTHFKEGLAFARGDRKIWALIVMTAAFGIFGFQFVVLLPVFARDVLDVGPSGFGVMSASVGIGAMISALAVAIFSPRMRRGAVLRWAGPAFGICVAIFAFMGWYPASLLFLGLAGFFMVLNNSITNSLVQGMVPDQLRGRVMSLWTFVFVGFAPIGSLQVGWLGEHAGAPVAVAVGGLISAAACAWIWFKWVPEISAIR
ncbi:MAG TPA: MFS transporter [Gemmatimonadales bacterium]|jgi:MFS family permease